MCFYKEGPARVLPSMQRASVGPGEGWARKAATQALLEKESHGSWTHTSSLSLLEPRKLRPGQWVLPLVHMVYLKRLK